MIFAFDIATRCTGWCIGTGETKPEVGFLRYDKVGRDIGALAVAWETDLNSLLQRFGKPTVVVYEEPIKTDRDKVLTLRKTYGMGYGLERWCGRRGILCQEESLWAIKKRLTGNSRADKLAMVDVVQRRLGIPLPTGEERKDMADAVGVWLTAGVDHHAKQFQGRWDSKLYGSRGGLL